MGLDIYVGTLTRYYAGDWKNTSQKFAEATGAEYVVVRERPENVISDRRAIREAVMAWQGQLADALARQAAAKVRWDESDLQPYFTDKPDSDGWGALCVMAAFTESGRPLPQALAQDWHEEVKSLGSRGRSNYRQIIEPQVWLPEDFDFVFAAETVAGAQGTFGSSTRLLQELNALNARSLRATTRDIERWRAEGPTETPGNPFDQAMRFGYAVFVKLAEESVEHRLPMLLDY